MGQTKKRKGGTGTGDSLPTSAAGGLPSAVKLVCLWLFLLPALILWYTTAKSHGVHVQWAAYLPLMIVFAVLALFLNRHPLWRLEHRWHIVAALATASVLASTMGMAGLALVQMLQK